MRVDAYLHSSKDSMYAAGLEAGLDEEAASNFRYALYEVKITLEVDNDGSSTIVAVNNKPVGDTDE